MPFDCTATDTTTQFLLELRDRLTRENWRPYAISYPLEFQAGKGCLIQQLHYVVRQRGGLPYDSLRSVQKRLIKAVRQDARRSTALLGSTIATRWKMSAPWLTGR